jgi:putative peptide zinc metalloprotease protein
MAEALKPPAVPRRAAGVTPVGPLQDGGFVEPQWLVRRHERFVQVSELLYRVVELANGVRTFDDIARELTATTEWEVAAGDVALIVQRRLAPLGLVEDPTGDAIQPRRAAPSPLLVAARVRVLGPAAIDRVARTLQHLYRPPVLAALLVVVAISQLWMFARGDPGAAMRDVVTAPLLLPAVIGLLVAAGAVHELGHASALRYGGGRARAMGAGIYLAIPVFYTDVTDSYRLSRRARLRTDLGGFYFHLLVAAAFIAGHAATGSDVLLLAAFLIDLDIVRQLIPFVRLDGYWVLADLTGIPDLFAHAGPRLRRLLPRAPAGPHPPPLRPRVRRAFAVYIALAVPAIVALIGYIVWHAPAVVRRGAAGLSARADLLPEALRRGDVGDALIALVELALLALPIACLAALAFVIVRFLTALVRRGAAAARSVQPKAATSPEPGHSISAKVVVPRSFEDAQEVVDRLKEASPVLLDLQALNTGLAKRLVDVAAGAVYALDGGMQRTAPRVFLLTPGEVVRVSGHAARATSGRPKPRQTPRSSRRSPRPMNRSPASSPRSPTPNGSGSTAASRAPGAGATLP